MVACMLALGVGVPWRDILVIYALTQISASLPITPGGIGVVEGSMTALLVGYGISSEHAFAVTMLYRIVSFWALVPIGWGAWAILELAGRSRIRRRPHPWARHEHGTSAARVPGRVPDRVLHTTVCRECDSEITVPVGTGRAEADRHRHT